MPLPRTIGMGRALRPAIPVIAGTTPVNTVIPAITGTAQPGQTLTSSTGTWTNSPTSYAYQWKRDGASISGATTNTYTVQSADIGTTLTVAVTATNASGTSASAATSTGLAISTLWNALSAAWKLSDLTDSSGNSLTLTNNNSATFTTGKLGNAVNLVRSSSQYLSVADNALLRPHATNGFTLACWFWRNGNANAHYMAAKGTWANANTEYVLFCSAFIDRVECYAANGSILTNINTATGSTPTGQWNLAILKSDGATVSLRANNGTAVTASMTGVKSNGTGAFNIGAGAATNFWDGLIDVTYFWQRCLTSTEEGYLWNAGSGLEPPF